jgi:diguanylate cyclase (GGDEF)-like protein
MIHQTFLRALMPWARRQPAATFRDAFDPRREQLRLSELALRQAACLLASACEEQGTSTAQVLGLCSGLVAGSVHLRLAWTWFGDRDVQEIVPELVVGAAAEYGRTLRIQRTRLTEHGPAFRALAGRRSEPFNVNEASLYGPWRDAARLHGVRSVMALPLQAENDTRRGLFVLYADVPDYFTQVGVELFEGLAQFVGALLSQATRHQRLAQLAHTDPLTGLHNRAAVQERLQRWPRGRPLGLLLLDLDHFKLVNDQHGHAAGDAMLVSCAERLRGVLRQNDGIARWGGEEFLAWLPDTSAADAEQVAQKLRQAVAGAPHVLPAGLVLPLTLSAGVASLAPGETLEHTIARADRALYAAKRAGRNRVVAG